jgi:hypothetical protein
MIDKSIRQYYDRGQLVKPGPGRPGYQGWDPGAGSPGTSSGGHQGGRGQDRFQAYQGPTSVVSTPSPHRDTSATRVEQAKADALNTAIENRARESAREKAIQTAALTTTTPTRSPHQVTKEQIEEQLALDLANFEFEDPKALEPTVPPKKYKTVTTRHPEVDDVVPTEIRDLYDPRGYEKKGIAATGTGRTWHEQAVKDAMPGFFDSGVGKIIKMVGLGLVAPHLLAGTKAGALLSAYNQYQGISKVASMLGVGPEKATDIMSSLTGNIEGIKEAFAGKPKDISTFNELGLYTDRFPTDTTKQARVGEDYRGVPISTAVAKGRGLESGAELLGLKDIKEHRADLSANDIKLINYGKKHGMTTPTEIKETVGAGFNQKKPPTDAEIKGVLEGTITEPTGIFAAHGGFIDRPLMGRSRDI